MELGGDESFRYIPFRCYYKDEPLIQRLIKPLTETGHRKTLSHLLQELNTGQNDFSNGKINACTYANTSLY